MAGDDFTADIREYMSRQHNVSVSERMAERIKIQVGSALAELPANEAPADYVVHGPNRIHSAPRWKCQSAIKRSHTASNAP